MAVYTAVKMLRGARYTIVKLSELRDTDCFLLRQRLLVINLNISIMNRRLLT